MNDDTEYFVEREEAELRLAEQANDPAVRHVHLAMATAYRRRLMNAQQQMPAQRATQVG